jgi:hypothetical protein
MRSALPVYPTADVAAIYPEVGQLRSALRARDWSGVRAALEHQEPAARTWLIRFAAEVDGTAPFLRQRLAEDPANPLAGVLLGTRLIEEAWAVRTRQRAKYVSADQFARFREILLQAEQVLIDAAAYQPDEHAVWVERLVSARGLGLGQSEARRRYDRLAEHDPHHLPGQAQLLQQLCPKWGGSFDVMHEFARAAASAAADGAHNAVLVAEAHLEHFGDLEGNERQRYIADPRVREEIREAADRSVRHPAFRRTIGWVWVESVFALMFLIVNDHAAAAERFAALGQRVSEQPWAMFGDPVEVFQEERARAFAKAGVR